MMANNWGICPKCRLTVNRKRQEARDLVTTAYGTVSQEEYMVILSNARTPEIKSESTLVEHYEIGITDDGEFYVDYRCGCSKCGFGFVYNVELDAMKEVK